MPERLYNPSGGYRDLKAYQLSKINYDATVAPDDSAQPTGRS